jgi:hypothetical protein
MERMTSFKLFVALLPVHLLSTPEEAQLTVTLLLATALSTVLLLPTMISLPVLVILHQSVDMQILHAPPALIHPCIKLSEEAQALTVVTNSVFLFIIRPVTVLMMHTTTTAQASGIDM